MGRRLDVLLGRTTKQTARLKSLLGLAVARLGVLRGHRQVRCEQARGDVEQLLRLGHPDRALLRADHLLRERNMLDALLMLQDYCSLLLDRAALVDAHRECPDELREAAAGLVYAAARCGDLPELQEVRSLLAAKFGREFVSSAAELRSGCGINTKIVQKMSTKQPSLESRQMVLQEIAAEAGITVHAPVPEPPCEGSGWGSGSGSSQRKKKHDEEERPRAPQVDTEEEDIAGGDLAAKQYRDVEAAAQAAFESAATAAAAAKAAMELSRGETKGPDSGRRRLGRACTGEAQREVLDGGEDLDSDDAARRGDTAESELRQSELQPDPARSRPASVRTRRGF